MERHCREWPSDGLETLGACPVCGNESRGLLYDGLTDIIFKNAPGEWTMWECSSCGSGYLDPRPSQDTIHIAYQNYYTHDEFAKPNSVDDPGPKTRLSRIRRTLANGYRNRKYGTSFEDAHWLGYWILENFPPSRELIDIQFRYLPRPETSGSGRLLDVGCGDGGFLGLARTAGWNVFGCDPDPAALDSASARDIEVRIGGAETWLKEEGTFDAVSLSHVLEHVHRPAETLKILNRLLRPGGFLYIDTPHIAALGHELFGRHWHGLDVPRHLSILSLKAIRQVLSDAGMKDVQFRRRKREFRILSRKSARLKAGLDPYSRNSESTLERPSKIDAMRAWFSSGRSESITVVCRKA